MLTKEERNMIRKIIMLIFTAILIAGIISGCRALKVYKDDMHRITREWEQYLSEQDEGKAEMATLPSPLVSGSSLSRVGSEEFIFR